MNPVRRSSLTTLLLTVLVWFGCALPVAHTQAQLLVELPPTSPGDTDFGLRVAASGDWFVATSRVGMNLRRVYVLRRLNGWLFYEYTHVLGASGARECEIAVHASGEQVTVVACDTSTDTALVLERSASGVWSASNLPAGPANSEYGAAVATNGQWIAIGAPLAPPANARGAVHLYWRNGSGWSSDILPSNLAQATPTRFGSALAIDAERLVIGAPDTFVNHSGMLAMHTLGANGQHAVEWWLYGPSSGGGEQFGSSLAIEGNNLVVGSPGYNAPVVSAGLALVFRRNPTTNQWTNTSTLSPANPSANARYGEHVALSGSRLLVGYGSESATAATFGAVDLALYSLIPFPNWYVAQTLVPGPHGSLGDRFGSAFAISGKLAFCGSPGDQTSGRLYVYVHDTLDCNQNGQPDMVETMRGLVADCDHDDVPDSCELANTPGLDCNGNGVLDSCDIASSTSADVNGDLVPDECQGRICALAELNAPNAQPGENLGLAVATDGVRVVSGAPRASHNGAPDAGAVVIHRRDGVTLTPEARLTAPAPHADQSFGFACAIQGDVALVGAPGDNERGIGAGAVYVFRRDANGTWAFESKLFGADTNANDGFGGALELAASRNNSLFIGAPGGDTPVGLRRGKVYVFQRVDSTWIQRNVIFALDGADGDAFGASVDQSQGTLAIGAPRADTSGLVDSGAVYTGQVGFDLVNPVVLTRLTPLTPVAGAKLGTSVAVDPNALRIAAGAFEDPTRGVVAGSVTVFARADPDHWGPSRTIHSAGTNAWDNFGRSVAWAGIERLVVGSPFEDTSGAAGSGALHSFIFIGLLQTVVEELRAAPADANYNQGYGVSLAWADGMLVTGAYGDDFPSGVDSGSVYVLGIGGRDQDSNLLCDLCDIAAGALPDANANGIADMNDVTTYCHGDGWSTRCPCANETSFGFGGCKHSFGNAAVMHAQGVASVSSESLALFVNQLPPSNPSVTFFQGTQSLGSGTPFGDGLFCVSGSIVRLGTLTPLGGGTGFGYQTGTQLISVRGQIPPSGGTRYYQASFRNAANFCTSATVNTTNGVAVVWTP